MTQHEKNSVFSVPRRSEQTNSTLGVSSNLRVLVRTLFSLLPTVVLGESDGSVAVVVQGAERRDKREIKQGGISVDGCGGRFARLGEHLGD